jgi:hypothetical protein
MMPDETKLSGAKGAPLACAVLNLVVAIDHFSLLLASRRQSLSVACQRKQPEQG